MSSINCLFPCFVSRSLDEAEPIYSVERIIADFFENLERGLPSKQQTELARAIEKLNSSEFYELLEKAAERLVQADAPEKGIVKFAQLLPLERLEAAIRERHPEHTEALEKIQALSRRAQFFLERVERGSTFSWKAELSAIVDGLISVLETICNAFGLADFFRPSESSLDNEIKSGRITQLLMLFTTISTLLIPLLGPILAGAIVGGFFVTTTVLSLVFPYIRPAPSKLPEGKNWTKECNEGKLAAPLGRETVLEEIQKALKIKKHPMLIGRSGIGKSETVKAFVQALERGDFSELQGKKVFYFNAAQFVQGAEVLSGKNTIFQRLDEALGRHRDDIILVFDEIHSVCENKSPMANQLKTLLDPDGAFPHVIVITTEEEYYAHIHSQSGGAFARRFKKIEIDQPTPSELLEILSNAILKKAPHLIVEEKSLQRLVQRTEKAFDSPPEPMSSLGILDQCMQRTIDCQNSFLAKEVERLRTEIRSLYTQSCCLENVSYEAQIADLQGQLQQAEQLLRQEQTDMARFLQLRDNFLEAKKQLHREIRSLAALPSTETQKARLAAFLFRYYLLEQKYTQAVKQEGRRLRVETTLDEALIDGVVEEELAQQQRAREGIERGKRNSEERKNGHL